MLSLWTSPFQCFVCGTMLVQIFAFVLATGWLTLLEWTGTIERYRIQPPAHSRNTLKQFVTFVCIATLPNLVFSSRRFWALLA
jgi:hypothetical protein